MDYRHVKTMTDENGIIQFSVNGVPDISSGYTVDDNARALLVALSMEEEDRKKYALTYTRFLYSAQREDGTWCNWKIGQKFIPDIDSEDSIGRAFLACSVAAQCDIEEVHRLSMEMVMKALPNLNKLSFPRSVAYGLVGISFGINVLPGYRAYVELVAKEYCQSLISLYMSHRGPGWNWFENKLTYCNAILPHALFAYYRMSGDKKALRVAEDTMWFLGGTVFKEGFLDIVGNKGWWVRGCEMPLYDQQPVDACSIALAAMEAYQITGRDDYLWMADLARAWYWGKNRNRISLYNIKTGGCHDALTEYGINGNQGAEAVVSFLLTEQAWQRLHKENREPKVDRGIQEEAKRIV
ncbi:MAG TPA: hypothetical protein GXX39_05905 [Syntrophothermus lipocalidus]|nr:hypothetical protein [Syntrophothermus lipocalidus]HOV43494.1 hypothetical protein [Syntrophothermus lipocalidus]